MAQTIGINQIYKGVKIEIDGTPYEVIEYEHVKPGKGQAFVRVKMLNLFTGNVERASFKSSDTLTLADCSEREMEFLYAQGDSLVFMDPQTYEQIEIPQNVVGRAQYFIKEGTSVYVIFYQGKPIGVNPPKHIDLVVTRTEPGVKGDTVSGAMKEAELETGLKIMVPLFIEEGDIVRVSSETGEYIERVNK